MRSRSLLASRFFTTHSLQNLASRRTPFIVLATFLTHADSRLGLLTDSSNEALPFCYCLDFILLATVFIHALFHLGSLTSAAGGTLPFLDYTAFFLLATFPIYFDAYIHLGLPASEASPPRL